MAKASVGAIRIIDSDGDPIDDGAGALKIALQAGAATRGHATIASYQHSSVDSGSYENLNGGSFAGGVGDPGDSIPCKHVDIMADINNTGIIYVGGSGVTANNGIALYPGDVYSIDIDDVNRVFVLASVDTEDAIFTVFG